MTIKHFYQVKIQIQIKLYALDEAISDRVLKTQLDVVDNLCNTIQ